MAGIDRAGDLSRAASTRKEKIFSITKHATLTVLPISGEIDKTNHLFRHTVEIYLQKNGKEDLNHNRQQSDSTNGINGHLGLRLQQCNSGLAMHT